MQSQGFGSGLPSQASLALALHVQGQAIRGWPDFDFDNRGKTVSNFWRLPFSVTMSQTLKERSKLSREIEKGWESLEDRKSRSRPTSPRPAPQEFRALTWADVHCFYFPTVR
jgi:hypothetical protein